MPSSAERFEPTWESLLTHQPPAWLMDAKFGLYAHWGPYSVPGFGNEWYGKRMYDTSNPVHDEHCRRFGDPSQFGYKDFIPMFTAEHYDPEAWADLYARSGARYGGLSLAHHDGFALWDSRVTRWCAANMGPKRDLYGPLAAALKQRDIKLVAPFHILRCFDWWLPGADGWGRGADAEKVARARAAGWDLFDPAFADFYWNHYTGKYEDFIERWRLELREVVDKYQPDLIWFDGGDFQDAKTAPYALDVLAHFLNAGAEGGRDVGVLNKFKATLEFNFPVHFGLWTFENGRSRPPVVPRPWVDDMRIGSGSWGYIEGQTYLSAGQILHGLIDRVSRGGGLLLSLSPKPDGTIPDGQAEALTGVGQWLGANGEAIYDTRPWVVPGEGPTTGFHGGAERGNLGWEFDTFTAEDIRYTQSADGETVYAIALGWPGKRLRLSLLGQIPGLLTRPIQSVALLGGGAATWKQRPDALCIELQDVQPPNDIAFAWRIDLA